MCLLYINSSSRPAEEHQQPEGDLLSTDYVPWLLLSISSADEEIMQFFSNIGRWLELIRDWFSD